ncbi:DUF2298 domain-containing protein [Andreprevotia lacus]|uniref:DUF2298 domain-containing protein n=1 Tax=Andreprevotia lacus TaxID=1121000 RepID=UPI001594CB1F|nr:DUF2298 domain-containing protein [Andreprevotia lacus]
MNAIYLALTVAILFVNSAGLAQLFQRWFGDRHIARIVGIFAICTPLFFIEHMVGLGKLGWLWPITTLAAAALLRSKLLDLSFWKAELPFIIPFVWALAWRFAYPDIDAATEHLTDLYFVSNYAAGDTLPPPDLWLPGFKFNIYYSFLPYCAALLGRWLGVGAGMAMNLSDVFIFGLLGSLAWSVASRFVANRWFKIIIVVAVIAGGTGLSPVLPKLFPGNPVAQMWGNTRFAGMFDQDIQTEFGQHLFPKLTPETAPVPGFEPRDLPLETLSYYLYLGDFHPPLGSFALVFLTLALFARLERREDEARLDERPLIFAIGASTVLPLALNVWVLPVQGLLVLGWLLYRWRGKHALQWPWLIAGGASVMVLIYPYFSEYVPNVLSTPIVLTDALDRTPLRQGLGYWWPVLWLFVLTIAQGPKQRLAWWSAWFVALIWLLAEFVTIDDPMGGRYQRFNTVLKWWSWLYPVAMLWLLSLNLMSRQLWVRCMALVPALAVSLYLIPQAYHWKSTPRIHAGRLQGDGWLRDDEGNRAILNWLRGSPRGLVLEGFDRGSYSPQTGFALHANQPSVLGWPDHINLWRNNPSFVGQRADALRALYQGQLPDAREWLKTQNVRYMVWSSFDIARAPQALPQLQTQLAPDYVWIPLYGTLPGQYGIFKRVN